MKYELSLLRTTRANTLKVLDGISFDTLCQIPEGFRNHLAWNFIHVWVTQQLLCYKLSGLEMSISPEIVSRYRKGTAPDLENPTTTAELALANEHFLSAVDTFEADLEKGIFKEFNTYPTSYNATLNSIEDAIRFNNVHEALHLGYMMAMKKALGI